MMLTAAQVFLFTLAVLALILVIRRCRQKRIGTLLFFLWLPLWGGDWGYGGGFVIGRNNN